jgi:hypothetical protein
MDHAMTATNTNIASSTNDNEMMDHDGKVDKKSKFLNSGQKFNIEIIA